MSAAEANRDGKRLLLTPTEVARLLSLDQKFSDPERVVRKMALAGKLVGVRASKCTMITAESVDAYVNGLKQ